MDDREINKFVGMKIKEFRKNKKLTQQDLADLVGVKNSAISNYEQGIRIPKRDFLFRVANALGVSIDEFFPIQSEETSSTLSEINKISSQLEEPRQKIVLDTASSQLKEQEEQKSKIVSIKNEQEKFDLADLVDDSKVDWDKWVSFDGRPLTDEVKDAMKKALGKELEDK
ncbi:helix-turn-helix domain-containing protein [Lactococcus lactis]|uniref:helix-turn-helix domain-containing protein n=1 Tax=Lactococcus lactis TaxID=1358 RepID=UPI002073B5ED|nr:helix-turn-helix domain-containing protein [Lactococcus lactis]MCM6842579.1 helix-turn-helix domain-containing protein [Lactococcus lactis]MCM6848383.1 helix-turn-helix domain-containing protein [Lactococcus lactis]MCM6850514.1 helix-turn-helix domain-containing protein [Lactococcus lactis]MCM6858247.1 helix-turn-helix domain-containing protein [Lactococcus lactis]